LLVIFVLTVQSFLKIKNEKSIITHSIFSLGIAFSAEDVDRISSPGSDASLSQAIKVLHYHGILDAQLLYEAESKKAIKSIGAALSMWKANPETLTKKVFWRFLESLEKKRRAIANAC